MNGRNVKKTLIIMGIITIFSIGIKELYFYKQAKITKVDVSADELDKDQLDDVVKTIVEINYQPITSIDQESTESGYIIINLNEEQLQNFIQPLLEMARRTNIKLTFMDQNGIFKEDNGYLGIIEKEGHTVCPTYINLGEIFNKNKIDIVESNSDIENLNKGDAAFIVTEDNISDKLINNIEEAINEMQNMGYHFKAFV